MKKLRSHLDLSEKDIFTLQNLEKYNVSFHWLRCPLVYQLRVKFKFYINIYAMILYNI